MAKPTADGMQSEYSSNIPYKANNAYPPPPPPPNMMYPPPQYNVVPQSQNPTVESGSTRENISSNAGVSGTTPAPPPYPPYSTDHSAAQPPTQQMTETLSAPQEPPPTYGNVIQS